MTFVMATTHEMSLAAGAEDGLPTYAPHIAGEARYSGGIGRGQNDSPAAAVAADATAGTLSAACASVPAGGAAELAQAISFEMADPVWGKRESMGDAGARQGWGATQPGAQHQDVALGGGYPVEAAREPVDKTSEVALPSGLAACGSTLLRLGRGVSGGGGARDGPSSRAAADRSGRRHTTAVRRRSSSAGRRGALVLRNACGRRTARG